MKMALSWLSCTLSWRDILYFSATLDNIVVENGIVDGQVGKKRVFVAVVSLCAPSPISSITFMM